MRKLTKEQLKIVCPKCQETQPENLHDLIDKEDEHGVIPFLCRRCEHVFEIVYATKPFVETRDITL